MLDFKDLNVFWKTHFFKYASEELKSDEGKFYRPIGEKSVVFLKELEKNYNEKSLIDIGKLILSGKTVKFCSDLHIEHENIIKLCQRPFKNGVEMDDFIYKMLEDEITKCDLMVILGDLALKNPLNKKRKIEKMFGNKVLFLIGNHDVKGADAEKWGNNTFSVCAFSLPKEVIKNFLIKDDLFNLLNWDIVPSEVNFGLSHWPIKKMPPGWVNIHGHIHNKDQEAGRLNCSIEFINYKPKELKDLIKIELIDYLIK